MNIKLWIGYMNINSTVKPTGIFATQNFFSVRNSSLRSSIIIYILIANDQERNERKTNHKFKSVFRNYIIVICWIRWLYIVQYCTVNTTSSNRPARYFKLTSTNINKISIHFFAIYIKKIFLLFFQLHFLLDFFVCI